MKLKKYSGLLLLALVVFLAGTPLTTWAQTDSGSSGKPSAIFSTDLTPAQSTAALMNELMGFAGQLGLECRNCNLNSFQDVHTFDLFLFAKDLESLKKFHTLAQDTWKTPIRIFRMAIKPNYDQNFTAYALTVNIVLAISPKPMKQGNSSIDETLNPLNDLPIFSPLAPSMTPEPHLFSFSCDEKEGRSFQIVSPAMADFAAFLKRPNLPLHSKTIFQSRFSGGNLFTMDFSENENLFPSSQLLSQFSDLAKLVKVREFSKDFAKLKPLSRIVVNVKPAELKPLMDHFARTLSMEPLQFEMTPEVSESSTQAESWNFQFLLDAKTPAQPMNLDEVEKVFSISWPKAVLETLKVSWTPSKILLSAETTAAPEMTGQSDLAGLKDLAAKLGLAPESAKKISNPQGEPKLLSTFSRLIGISKSTNTPAETTSFKDIFSQAEILEDIPSDSEHHFLLRVPFGELGSILEKLAPTEGLSLSQLRVSCQFPQPAMVNLTLLKTPFVGAKGFHLLSKRLTGAALPWNQPEDSLKKGIIIQELSLNQGGDFEIKGITLKSPLIFSSLFPALMTIPGVSEPFLSEGHYQDHPLGRLMTFRVTARFLGTK